MDSSSVGLFENPVSQGSWEFESKARSWLFAAKTADNTVKESSAFMVLS